MALVQLSSHDRIDIPISQEEFVCLPLMMKAKLMLVCADAYIYKHLDSKAKKKWTGLWTLVFGSIIEATYTLFLIWVLWPYLSTGGYHGTD